MNLSPQANTQTCLCVQSKIGQLLYLYIYICVTI